MPYKDLHCLAAKESQRKRHKKWYLSHKEQAIDCAKNYYQTHKKSELKRGKKYRENHRKQRKEYAQRWRKLHQKEWREYMKRWCLENLEMWKIIQKKHRAKRRKLGFIPLNELFDGAIGHHINKIYVVYIPEDLHHSVYHNIWTGQGMAEINEKVFKWIVSK